MRRSPKASAPAPSTWPETRRSLREREAKAELQRAQGTQEQTKATQRERLTVLNAPKLPAANWSSSEQEYSNL